MLDPDYELDTCTDQAALAAEREALVKALRGIANLSDDQCRPSNFRRGELE